MGNVSRTFKLRLSPAGMDMLIAAHCRLIQETRQLLPWGTTLHAAVVHLDSAAPDQVAAGLDRIAAAGLCGTEVRFLGAPSALNDVASRIIDRVVAALPGRRAPALLQVYILSLETLVSAEAQSLERAYRRATASDDASCRSCPAAAKENGP
jgi:hypothetical protein